MDNDIGTEAPMTPTAQSAVPATSPGGTEDAGKTPDILAALLAFRDTFETWKGSVDDRLTSIVGGLNTVEARAQVLESDVRQLRTDVKTVTAAAAGARERADTAHTMAETASVAFGRASQDQDGEREALIGALTETRGQLKTAIEAIDGLRANDEVLKKSDVEILELMKKANQSTLVDFLGKNPRLMAAIIGLLLVLTNMIGQRLLLSPAAPNQGALPAPTPTVHLEAP